MLQKSAGDQPHLPNHHGASRSAQNFFQGEVLAANLSCSGVANNYANARRVLWKYNSFGAAKRPIACDW